MPKPRYRYRYRYQRRPSVDLEKVLRTVLILLIAAIVIGSAFIGTLFLRVEKTDLLVSGLPDQLRNMRIVYLSDIHYGPFFSQKRVESLVKTVNEQKANLVILGGDYASDPESAIEFFRILPKIESQHGVYAVVGDTDRTLEEGRLEELLTAMRDAGVKGLVNSAESFDMGGVRVQIVGLDDYYAGYPNAAAVAKTVRTEDFVIVAGHSPDLLASIRDAQSADGSGHWYDMALFGHTHGGQINLLGFTPLYRLTSLQGNRYHRGWAEQNRAQVLISNGVGTEVVPLRLFAPPQIHVAVLKKGK